jgi:hypothetical protein
LLESVLGATPREFESRILRHADLRQHPGWAASRLSRRRDVSQFLATKRFVCHPKAVR